MITKRTAIVKISLYIYPVIIVLKSLPIRRSGKSSWRGI